MFDNLIKGSEILSVRIQKFLADAGIASRRKAEKYIIQGRISVNDKIVTELGTKIDSEKDIVAFDGNIVKIDKKLVYIMLNKPEGCITTVKDQFDRKTVLEYLKDVGQKVYPVGRLDYDTSGLLLLTNDGDLTYRLTHPKHNVEKTYIANVETMPTKDELKRFKNGLVIDGRKTAPAKISVIKSKGKLISLKITIHEGRNRQVRKMCSAINHPVKHLKRIAVGNLFLDGLKKGEYRYLNYEEIEYLKSL